MPYKNSTNSTVKCTRNAETQVASLEVVREPSAARRAETLGNILIGPAPDDTESATTVCSPRRAVRWCSIVFVVIAILDPLRDTTVHIVEAKLIRCEFSASVGGQLVLSAAVTASVACANLFAP